MKLGRFILSVVVLLTVIGGWFAYDFYQRIYAPNVELGQGTTYFYIPSGATYADVLDSLRARGMLKHLDAFEWVAEKKNYPNLVKAGRYLITDGMSNNSLVDLLRSGEQEPVNVVITPVRTKAELAGIVASYIEADSVAILRALNDPQTAAKYGFSPATFITMFITNTYQFYWSTTVGEFLDRMASEYKNFWTEERKAKAKNLNMSQSEVAILASIVQAEQSMHRDERPTVAGLYLNRLRRNMALQSDPTLIYAAGDFTIKRVLKAHREINSPYNTYKHTGLPPGPIQLPDRSSLDAVLNAEKHNYIYMCAKEDFSGYHNFSSSYLEHMRNARRYQKELNRRGVFR